MHLAIFKLDFISLWSPPVIWSRFDTELVASTRPIHKHIFIRSEHHWLTIHSYSRDAALNLNYHFKSLIVPYPIGTVHRHFENIIFWIDMILRSETKISLCESFGHCSNFHSISIERYGGTFPRWVAPWRVWPATSYSNAILIFIH